MIMCFGVWWQWIAVGVIAVVAVVLVFGRGHCGRGRCEGRSNGGKNHDDCDSGPCHECPLSGGCNKH